MIVYKVTNSINDKIYIGQTIKTLAHRKRAHINSAKRGDTNFYFHNALSEHGFDNFKWEILRICDSIESLNSFEEYYILYYDSMVCGYNLKSGGLNNFLSEKTKLKIGDGNRGKNNANFGKHLPKETRDKISKANLGDKNWNYKGILPEKVRNKISESLIKFHEENPKEKEAISQRMKKLWADPVRRGNILRVRAEKRKGKHSV